jgi:hypothetical protein
MTSFFADLQQFFRYPEAGFGGRVCYCYDNFFLRPRTGVE